MMKQTDSAIDFADTLFPHQKCSFEASLFMSIIVQAVWDLDNPDTVIKDDARDYFKGNKFKKHVALLNLEFDFLKHCFTDEYLIRYVKNKRRREKYANRGVKL